MFDTFCHEHLEYYSAKVINEMSNKNNLRIFDVKQNNINGGSVQFYICKQKAKYKDNLTALKKIYKTDKKYKLDKVITYRKFIRRVDKIKNSLIDVAFLKRFYPNYFDIFIKKIMKINKNYRFTNSIFKKFI